MFCARRTHHLQFTRRAALVSRQLASFDEYEHRRMPGRCWQYRRESILQFNTTLILYTPFAKCRLRYHAQKENLS